VHHPAGTPLCEKRAELVTRVREGVKNAARATNQLLLLHHLHETRMGSDLLLPRDTPTTPGPQAAQAASAPDQEAVGAGVGDSSAAHDGSDPAPTMSTRLPSLAISPLSIPDAPAMVGAGFPPMAFACPLKFSTKIPLNHRLHGVRR
ncbi:unnamed protein product, partial [Chrysoparadoxa australica]